MKKIAVLLACALCAAPAFAGDKGILKLSLWDDIAVAVPNNIHNVTGLSLGIGSKVDTLDGIQWDFIYNDAYKVRGLKGAIYSTADIVYGIQGGLVSVNRQEVKGIQGGLVTINQNDLTGLQYGFVNIAHGHVTGVQLGFVNYVNNIKGLQIGLVNIAKNGYLPAMIFINGRF
ncbi:MAG: hypothetical protein IKO35_02475 [Elusimicrobiaceae bacterium]|nr:hypothetical protein [Elusimicrobiaceae bacterium]